LQQSILDMEVDELVIEAPSGVDELDDRGVSITNSGDSSRQISSQGNSTSGATKRDGDSERELIPNCNSVPSFSPDVSDDARQTSGETVPTDGDTDIVMYVAVGLAVMITALAVYKQVVQK